MLTLFFSQVLFFLDLQSHTSDLRSHVGLRESLYFFMGMESTTCWNFRVGRLGSKSRCLQQKRCHVHDTFVPEDLAAMHDFGFKPRWWFQTFFICTPVWGRFPFWRSYFSNGLKPPTRNSSTTYLRLISFMTVAPARLWLDLFFIGNGDNRSQGWSQWQGRMFRFHQNHSNRCGERFFVFPMAYVPISIELVYIYILQQDESL